jgi:hypothetical protein
MLARSKPCCAALALYQREFGFRVPPGLFSRAIVSLILGVDDILEFSHLIRRHPSPRARPGLILRRARAAQINRRRYRDRAAAHGTAP